MNHFLFALIALAGLLAAGCKDPAVENKAKLEAQWKLQIRAFVNGDKAGFESVLCAASKAQPSKVNATFGIVTGLAKLLKITEVDVRIENVSFHKEFTQATVATAHKAPKEPTGWKPFPDAEIWIRENGQWLRQL